MSLRRALLEHGVSDSQAEQIEADIARGCAVLTVYGEDDPARVSELPSAVSVAGSGQPDSDWRDFERSEEERSADDVYGYDELATLPSSAA